MEDPHRCLGHGRRRRGPGEANGGRAWTRLWSLEGARCAQLLPMWRPWSGTSDRPV